MGNALTTKDIGPLIILIIGSIALYIIMREQGIDDTLAAAMAWLTVGMILFVLWLLGMAK